MMKLFFVIFLITLYDAQNGMAHRMYDSYSGSFEKVKRNEMFCKRNFCMRKKTIVRIQTKSESNIKQVLNKDVISQCAPSLDVKVKHTL